MIIAAGAFVLSIFAANWLNLRKTGKRIERVDKQLAAQFGGVKEELTTRLGALEDKIDYLVENFRSEPPPAAWH